MQCSKCGAENPDDAQLCRSCGWVLTNASTTSLAPDIKTSRLAIASLMLGIMSIFAIATICGFPIIAIPAVVLGIVGLVKIEKSAGQLKGKGLAIAGIVVPMIGLFVSVLILLPALARTRQVAFATRMVCAQNMSSLGRTMLIYAGDYDEKFPTFSKWCDLLIEYADLNHQIFRCKGAPGGPCNYAMNKYVENLEPRTVPPDIVLLFEAYPGWNQVGGPEILTTDNHKGDGCNVLFFDLHVAFVKTKDLDDLRWKPEQNE